MPLDMRARPTASHQPAQPKPEYHPEQILEAPHDMLIAGGSAPDELHWRGLEYEPYEKSQLWYLGASVIIGAIALYALVTNNPIVAITFILIGAVGYLHLNTRPDEIDFRISGEGILTGKQLYEYDNLGSFWIFYDPPHEKVLSLLVKSGMMPYVHIPLGDQDPVAVRELLLKNIPEIKQEKGFLDILERLLHI